MVMYTVQWAWKLTKCTQHLLFYSVDRVLRNEFNRYSMFKFYRKCWLIASVMFYTLTWFRVMLIGLFWVVTNFFLIYHLIHETRDGVNSYEVQHLYKHPLRIPHTSYFSLTFLTFLKRVVLSTCFRLHDKWFSS